GVLGLEAASEFLKTGRRVTIVEMAPSLMGRQLDETGSRFLKAAAEAKGARVITGANIQSIEAGGVQLEGEMIPAQLVILSTGTKANVQVLQTAGASAERFVNVNDHMETTLPDVFAAGDVAACNGVSIGIWNQAVEMGRVAGANAVGDSLVYEGITPAVSFTGFGIDLFALGDTGKKEGEIYKTIEVDDPRLLTYRKFYFLHDVFAGAVVIGDTSCSGKVLEAYQNKADVETTLALLHKW
ncbi:MAG: FAD-dependent oxidoreductase, partial [Firmicutes bacterium]|nr:FAD-dependent oxidoreductase [Bacillota bacterium]